MHVTRLQLSVKKNDPTANDRPQTDVQNPTRSPKAARRALATLIGCRATLSMPNGHPSLFIIAAIVADNNGRNYGQTAQWGRWALVVKSEIPARELQAPSAPQREKRPRQTGLGEFDIKSTDRIRLRTGCIVIASSVWSYLHFFVSPPLHFFSLPYSVPIPVYTTVHRAGFFSVFSLYTLLPCSHGYCIFRPLQMLCGDIAVHLSLTRRAV